jgi:hypothetical protein
MSFDRRVSGALRRGFSQLDHGASLIVNADHSIIALEIEPAED